MGHYYQSYNYTRNPRFYHQSEQASESALVEINSDETEKLLPIKLERPDEDSLSAQMLGLYEKLLPTEESAKKREELANKIEKILNEEWPGNDIKVHMFGSSMNDLGTTQSDVDLCVVTKWNGLNNIYVLSECLRRHGMRIEQTVSKAKVPIVRLSDPNLNLACDINVNNTLALHNTRLIRKYVDIDPRVRPIAMVVKHWARKRVLNDAAKGGTISTYTWTCIILNFLQMRNPPILPVLHKLPHEGVEPIIVNGEDASFYEEVETLKTFGESNRESLGGLLFAFFRRMAFEFDYDNHVISLRQGKYLTKVEKGWDTCKGWKMLCIEEPFNTARNLGNSADDISVNGLKQEFRRAYDILRESANLDLLCEEYRFQQNIFYYNNNYNYNKNYINNRVCKPHKRSYKTNSTGYVKPGNRNSCPRLHNGQQNEQTNYTTDNFHDNGKSNYSQENEEGRSSMPRFHVDEIPHNGHYSTINGSDIAPVSDVDNVKRDFDAFPARKQLDSYQNRRERNGLVSQSTRQAEVNNSQIQHHNVSLDLKEEEQLPYSHPQIKNFKNNNSRQGLTRRKNDERFLYSDQSNNYIRQPQDSDPSKSSQDTTSNQNQSFYKNNNQKVDSRSRSYSEQKSNYSQNVNASYGSDVKYNNGYSRRQNTSSDLDQKSFVAHNSNYSKQKSLNKQDYSNSRQVEDSNSSSIISSRSKPNSSIVDDTSNFDRSNPVQMSSPKSVYKSNNYNYKNNSKQNQFYSKSPQQFQKSADNFDLVNNTYSPYYNNGIVMVPMTNDSIYSANHSNNGLMSSQNMFTPSFQNQHGQLNDGTANYLRRNSHQSSSDGSNSQTSGNTSNTSYSNNSNYAKHGNQKNNGNNGNNGNQNQINYLQQPRQNKLNSNCSNNNGKKRKNNNNNRTSGNNGYFNSGNGNYRLNNTTSNSSSEVAPSVSDSTLNYYEEPIIPTQMNQGHHSMSKVVYDYNGDTNGYKACNFKSYNGNNSNVWKSSNGHNTRIINGSNNTNGPKSINGGSNSSNRNVNNSNPNYNYSRSNGNNYNNKLVNGNNQNAFKSVDANNNSNTQTRNANNNSNNSNSRGNNNSGNTNIQRNNNGYYYNKNRNSKNMQRNSNTNCKVEKKEDGFNFQQQYSQQYPQQYSQQYSQEIQLPSSQRQNNHNIQSHQQNNSHQQESGSKSKNMQKKRMGQKRNTYKEFQQQQ